MELIDIGEFVGWVGLGGKFRGLVFNISSLSLLDI